VDWTTGIQPLEKLIKYARDLRPPRLQGRAPKKGMQKFVK